MVKKQPHPRTFDAPIEYGDGTVLLLRFDTMAHMKTTMDLIRGGVAAMRCPTCHATKAITKALWEPRAKKKQRGAGIKHRVKTDGRLWGKR